MSPNALIPSHRKPRRSASSRALRAGVTGGFLTLAVTGATVPANAAEKPVSETQEMPTITTALATSAAKSADAAQQAAFSYERQALQDAAAAKADKDAGKAKAAAEKKAKAEAEAKKAADEARKAKEAVQARASRSDARTTLSAVSDAPSTGSSSGSVSTLVSFLKAQLGKAYVLGSSGPSSYDCSGLTQAAFSQIGIDLPRVSQSQSTTGTQVGLGNLQVGDILYWGSAGSAYHVAVYVGNGNFIGAQNPSTGIVERPLSYDMPTGAVRVL
ncbi:C40 family peptidase [Streptomyces sp. NPDC059101]|uniref:C40 family peptidase n=1 Tax=Streptomyces sp. NPDC059101 TaxID=3346728 RepID=UPI0036CBF7F4